MTDDLAARAREVFDSLEAGDASGVTDRLSSRLRPYVESGDWSVADYIRDDWGPHLGRLAGSSRRIVDTQIVAATMTRFTVEGSEGRAYATIRFDETGGLDGIQIVTRIFDGIHNVVVNCPGERVGDLIALYDALLGPDPRRLPRFVFDEGDNYVAPQWPDPAYPQQMHFDISVADMGGAHDVAVRHGATLLHDGGGHRVYADPIGHPFCLYGGGPSERLGTLVRIVIDCPDAGALAAFYSTLLAMPHVVQENEHRIVVAGDDRDLPMLAFQQVAVYHRPTWPDPTFLHQVHFDLKFDDRAAAAQMAVQLGAVPLPPQGGSCPVFADPAGHPFCLCLPGE